MWNSIAVLILGLSLFAGRLAAQPLIEGEIGSLSGRIINALTGQPIRKASVKLFWAGSSANSPAKSVASYKGDRTAVSGTDGSFHVSDLEPGKYSLVASKAGFLESSYSGKAGGNVSAFLLVSPHHDVADMAIGLLPLGVVSGKILDEDGDPVHGATVQLIAKTWYHGKARYQAKSTCTSSDLGEYRCPELPPGRYYTAVMPRDEIEPHSQADRIPIKTYYPNAAALSHAIPLDIQAGQDISATNVELLTSTTFHVRGRVSGKLRNVVVILQKRDDDDFSIHSRNKSVQTRPDGTFDIPNVSPGSYNLGLLIFDGEDIGGSLFREVEVNAADVNDLSLAIAKPTSVKVKLTLDGKAPGDKLPEPAKVHLVLIPPESSQGMGPIPVTDVAPNSEGLFLNVAPAKYKLQIHAPPATYIKSVRSGRADVFGKVLDWTDGAAGDLDITLSYGTAEISGTPKPTTDSLPPASEVQARVVLIPDQPGEEASGDLNSAATDGDGHFAFQNLRPGAYRLVALQGSDFEQLQNPEVLKLLEGTATPFELKESEKKELQPNLISADEWKHLLLRAGATAF